MSALWPDLFFLVWNFHWSPFCPSQKYFLRWKCSAPHLALLRSPMPEHWHSTMGALMPQRAMLLLRNLQQLPLHQRPRPKGPHSAVSLLGAEQDLIVSGPRTHCPKWGVLLRLNKLTWEGTAELLTCPAAVLAPLGIPVAADTFLVLCWFYITISLCFFYSHLNPWCWILQRGKNNPVFLLQCDRHDH